MKLAFYYHIPFSNKTDGIYLPGYLGVFIDSLASNVEELSLVLHSTSTFDENLDYRLKANNIKMVSLGTKTPAWHRAIYHKKILKEKLKEIEHCQILLVRSPSPLAPYFYKYLNETKLVFLIVGDYKSGADLMKVNGIRDRFIQLFLKYNNYLFNKQIQKTDIIVNSSALVKKYENSAKSVGLIKTTTLSQRDFFERNDTCNGEFINLLYTGRIDAAKGLFELLEAFAELKKEIQNLRLHYVGWEDHAEKPVESALKTKAKQLNIEEYVTFHGKKTLGDELNAMYRMADIYVIPSYHEGFPRTIWEAMANGLPVIATAVGGIPSFLHHLSDAFLISTKSSHEIEVAVKEIIRDSDLRHKLTVAGITLARQNTLENQSIQLVQMLNNLK